MDLKWHKYCNKYLTSKENLQKSTAYCLHKA